MAVSLTATLASHAASNSRRPHILVTAQPERFQFPLFEWRRLWHDDHPDSPSAVAVTAVGDLLRVLNVAGTIHVQRVSSPTSPTAAWTTWDASFATSASGRGVAVAAHPTNGEVVIAYSRSNTLYQRVSTDHGVTFAAETTIVAEASPPTAVALAYRTTTGNLCAFLTFGTTVRRCRRTSGTWAGTSTAWTLSMATVTGIAACHDGSDFALLVTGTQVTTTHKRVYATRMGDVALPTNAWAALAEVAASDLDSDNTYHAPGLIPVGAAGFYGAFADRFAGAVAVDRAYWTHTAFGGTASSTWLEPAPHEHRSAYGLALAIAPDGTHAYASGSGSVYRAELGATADLTSALVSARVAFGPTSTSATLVFDDAAGAYVDALGFPDATPDPSGAVLAPGHQLRLAPGYLTSAGAEYGVIWRLMIDSVATSFSRDGKRLYTVECSGPWEAVNRWHATAASQVATGTLSRSQIFIRVAGRAGVPVTQQSSPYSTSTTWEAHSPSFAHVVSESGAATLRRLLRPVADVAAPDAPSGGFLLRSWEDPRWEPLMRRLEPAYWFRLHDGPGAVAVQDQIAGQNLVPTGAPTTGPTGGHPGPLAAQPTGAHLFDLANVDVFSDHATKSWHTGVTGWTLLALVNPASYTARSVLVFNGLAVPPTGDGYALTLLANGHIGYLAEWVALDDMGTPAVPLDQWSFLALNRDTTTTRAYVDGVQTSSTSSATPTASASTFTIGGQWAGAGYGNSFDGLLSEAALFERALTGEELEQLQEARDPAQHTFGGNGHPIRTAAPAVASPSLNWSQVGSDIGNRADDFDALSVYRDGARLRTLRVLDANSDAKVQDYAEGQRESFPTQGGDLVAPWHPGLQLGDVIAVNDATPQASLWRIHRLALHFDRGRTYDAHLTLGAL